MKMDITELIEYIGKHQAIPVRKISPNSRIVEDLGIDGDDGIELIRDLEKEWEVDLSHHDFDQDFGQEGINLGEMFRKIFAKKKEGNLSHSVLTVEKLLSMMNESSPADLRKLRHPTE
jgi:acyl carrier protein